jgi:hypothetical protein
LGADLSLIAALLERTSFPRKTVMLPDAQFYYSDQHRDISRDLTEYSYNQDRVIAEHLVMTDAHTYRLAGNQPLQIGK